MGLYVPRVKKIIIIKRQFVRRRKLSVDITRASIQTSLYDYLCMRDTESKIEAQTSSAKTVAKVGSDVSLWCNATGYPKPVVYWTREDRNRRLPDGNQQFWVRSGLTACLLICFYTLHFVLTMKTTWSGFFWGGVKCYFKILHL